ncbi:predicted protein [Chaetoceros tenuissimus]|uniref:Uncharacterized protein n=1 Tax=Chaetoceros tenuissimus TaxID=426638 RepID=A0AAD3D4S9_9STRA|nr:predicted protein [Chaetoceros tenuissimus]
MMAMKSEDIENQRTMVKIALPQQDNKNYNNPRLGEDAAFFFCCATPRRNTILWVTILLILELANLIFSLVGNVKNAGILILDAVYIFTALVGHYGCVNDDLKLINLTQIACIVKASYQGVALLFLATSWTTFKRANEFF